MCPSRPIVSFLLSVALAAPALAQAPKTEAPAEVLVLVQAESLDLGAKSLAAELSTADLDRREAFLEHLVRRLGEGDQPALAARAWLAEQVKGQGELAWTARLIQREVRRAEDTRALAADPLTGLLHIGGSVQPGSIGLRILGADDRANPGKTDASKELEVWIDQASEGVQRFPVANLKDQAGCTFELRCGPGETRVRVLEAPQTTFSIPSENPGEEAEQVWTAIVREYTGASLVDILSQNPDLVEMLPFEVAGIPPAKTTPRSDVLGVFTHVLTEERRAALGLPPGVGLEVARVVPGTIAHALGIDRGAVVLEVNDEPVSGGDGISSVLRAAREAATATGSELEVSVVWIDTWGHRQRRIWRGPLVAR